VRLSDRGRSHWYRSTRPGGDGAAIGDQGGFTQDLINFSHTNNVGAIELVVQGQVLKGGRVVATANLSREYVVVPKCCQRTFGGPAQMFGNDFRWCNGLDMAGYPPLVLGLKNTANDLSGGVYVLTNTTPELRLRTDPSEPPPRILCYVPTGTATGTCGGRQELDGVPVLPTSLSFPSLPHLGSSGLPCKTNDTACLASTPPSTAFSIELFNRNNGASENSATEIYAKDYLRVRKGAVEICNKKYSATGAKAATIADYDRTPEIVPDSCQDLSDYCVQQVTDGYATYHCRVKNIYVNDFGADGDMQVRQNNTLFIDTSNGPIYLYIYDQWAKKSVLPGDPVLEQMGTFNYNLDFPPSNFAPIYTVGGYNDGQIQHVQCEPYTDVGTACVDESKASSAMTRAEIISDLANTATNLSDYTALIGDDGFVRDVFFWMPKASFHLAGDPNLVDTGGDAPQGKPQLSAGLWLNTLRFTRRTSELYLPSAVDQFFPFLLTPNDRLVAIVYDWVARSSTITSLFQQAP
jgi:hypothetical protein